MRYGQTRPVRVYRLLVAGTIDEDIYVEKRAARAELEAERRRQLAADTAR